MPNFVRGALGWFVAFELVRALWGTLAPIVAEASRVKPVAQHVCPYPLTRHGVGSNLKTYVRVRDLCATANLN